ncbi:uncharacterized protein Z518_06292 [Rhinocladiella mackenziei CBS 650.93]|uniref:Uncharacterized protein n=1 Tax=Rhinocladiella mackenziei CBS 650.93 TaxID=1442369 RepID=A0A0D2J8J3_9EURO|nr:uncharacterized protein Z518_06292 [Rhinocladiella mackenziei CBS 650.93]KIX05420.1 hypothetical protein Z518_06292 [Rhinocladiella mackenziei CBS 650.93]
MSSSQESTGASPVRSPSVSPRLIRNARPRFPTHRRRCSLPTYPARPQLRRTSRQVSRMVTAFTLLDDPNNSTLSEGSDDNEEAVNPNAPRLHRSPAYRNLNNMANERPGTPPIQYEEDAAVDADATDDEDNEDDGDDVTDDDDPAYERVLMGVDFNDPVFDAQGRLRAGLEFIAHAGDDVDALDGPLPDGAQRGNPVAVRARANLMVAGNEVLAAFQDLERLLWATRAERDDAREQLHRWRGEALRLGSFFGGW